VRPRIPLVSVLAAAWLVAIAAACSLTTSLTGFSGGPDDRDGASGGDAPSSPIVEGGTPDGQSADDAGTPFRCTDQKNAVLCTEFEGSPVSLGWDYTYTNAGSTIESGAGRSGGGLVVRIPAHSALASSARPEASLETPVAIGTKQPITLAFDMKLPAQSNGGGNLDIGGIVLHGKFYIVGFRLEDGGGFKLLQYADPQGAVPELNDHPPLLVQPPFGTWFRAVLALTFPAGQDAHLKVTFDGIVAYDTTVAAAAYGPTPSVDIGILEASLAGDARALAFDNVLVTSP
jgi:hypothetical protein